MESDKVTYAECEVCSDEEAGNGRVTKTVPDASRGKMGRVSACKVKRGEQLIVSDV